MGDPVMTLSFTEAFTGISATVIFISVNILSAVMTWNAVHGLMLKLPMSTELPRMILIIGFLCAGFHFLVPADIAWFVAVPGIVIAGTLAYLRVAFMTSLERREFVVRHMKREEEKSDA